MTDRTRAAHRDRTQRKGVPRDDIVHAVHSTEVPPTSRCSMTCCAASTTLWAA
jgi:hypothetical protein